MGLVLYFEQVTQWDIVGPLCSSDRYGLLNIQRGSSSVCVKMLNTPVVTFGLETVDGGKGGEICAESLL